MFHPIEKPANRLILALSILVLVVSIPAWVSASVPAGCGALAREASFAATFDWPGAVNKSAQGMVIRIAGAEIAEILEGQRCMAICKIKAADTSETGRAIASLAPKQLDLDCEAAGFAGLVGPATLIFKGPGNPAPMIRFGSWLEGYRGAPLKVMTDHLSGETGAALEVPVRTPEVFYARVQRKPAQVR